MNDTISGEVSNIQVLRSVGPMKREVVQETGPICNMILNAGLDLIGEDIALREKTDYMSPVVLNVVAFGTDNTPSTPGMTGLVNRVFDYYYHTAGYHTTEATLGQRIISHSYTFILDGMVAGNYKELLIGRYMTEEEYGGPLPDPVPIRPWARVVIDSTVSPDGLNVQNGDIITVGYTVKIKSPYWRSCKASINGEDVLFNINYGYDALTANYPGDLYEDSDLVSLASKHHRVGFTFENIGGVLPTKVMLSDYIPGSFTRTAQYQFKNDNPYPLRFDALAVSNLMSYTLMKPDLTTPIFVAAGDTLYLEVVFRWGRGDDRNIPVDNAVVNKPWIDYFDISASPFNGAWVLTSNRIQSICPGAVRVDAFVEGVFVKSATVNPTTGVFNLTSLALPSTDVNIYTLIAYDAAEGGNASVPAYIIGDQQTITGIPVPPQAVYDSITDLIEFTPPIGITSMDIFYEYQFVENIPVTELTLNTIPWPTYALTAGRLQMRYRTSSGIKGRFTKSVPPKDPQKTGKIIDVRFSSDGKQVYYRIGNVQSLTFFYTPPGQAEVSQLVSSISQPSGTFFNLPVSEDNTYGFGYMNPDGSSYRRDYVNDGTNTYSAWKANGPYAPNYPETIFAPYVPLDDAIDLPMPTNVVLASDGVTLTGEMPYAGTAIQVSNGSEILYTSGTLPNSEPFELTLSFTAITKYIYDVRVIDTLGNSSSPVSKTGTVIGDPDPLTNVNVALDGQTVTGRTGYNTTKVVLSQNGVVIVEAVVTPYSDFLVFSPDYLIWGLEYLLTPVSATLQEGIPYSFML